MKVLGVFLDRRLTFEKQVMAVARSCNYHAQAIRHICHLLTTELATTLACRLILTRLDYCNSLLHGAPSSSIRKLQRVQNNTTRIILQAPRRSHVWPLLRQLHYLPVRYQIDYKLAVMTYKVRTTATPTYLSRHLTLRQPARTLSSLSPEPRLSGTRYRNRPPTATHCQCLNVD